ncbi:MAG: AraC family transcriptional regulator [Gemmatimonadales bacterium]|jgi:AraC-like DNA-binding protein
MRKTGRPESVDEVTYETELVTIGAFRAGVDDPIFRDSGPAERPIFVFPRTSVVIRHVDKQPFATDTCTVTYYNRGQRYTREPIDPRGDRCEWFSVRPDVLLEVLAAYEPDVVERPAEPFSMPCGPSDAHSYAAQRTVVRHVLGEEPPDPLAVEESVVAILDHLLTLAHGRPNPADAGRLAPAVRRYLADHFTAADSLEEIAAAVDCSVFHLCRVFRDETGTTIHRYRHQLRLRRSLELVAEPDSDLTDVAFQLGFSSHSHFTAAFRKAFGTTPSEFRRAPSSRRVRELGEGLG